MSVASPFDRVLNPGYKLCFGTHHCTPGKEVFHVSAGECSTSARNAPQQEGLSGPPAANRHRLPDERAGITHHFSIAGHEGYLTVGLYPNGQPGEIFIRMAKEGSTIAGLMECFGTVVSVSLQHGVPLKVLCDKLSHTRFEPSGELKIVLALLRADSKGPGPGWIFTVVEHVVTLPLRIEQSRTLSKTAITMVASSLHPSPSRIEMRSPHASTRKGTAHARRFLGADGPAPLLLETEEATWCVLLSVSSYSTRSSLELVEELGEGNTQVHRAIGENDRFELREALFSHERERRATFTRRNTRF